LYEQLQHAVLPRYYAEPVQWRSMMKQAIGNIGYYFNSHRMMRRYATEAYLR
jgi:starch phosphorylase